MTVTSRLSTLRDAVDLTAGRVPPEVEAKARRILDHASQRLAVGPQTVAALAGATGSGKSSLFNAISGTTLAEQGARRPTTSRTLAASFSATNPALLDLLGVERRHEAQPPQPGMADLVLLDLPDHDSTATAHRDEVDRLVEKVDLFIWVLDPQKYADAAIHERYLRPLARHREVITVVLNQADKLTPSQLEACLAHIRRLLADDGLDGVPVMATSALTGQGIPELRTRLAELATQKRAAAERLAADVDVVARDLDDVVGRADGAAPSKESVTKLTKYLAASAQVPVVVDAVRTSLKHRGHLATGWPMVKWIGRLKPDPLKRLRLGGSNDKPELESGIRTSLPGKSATATAQLATGLRAIAQELSVGMPALWQQAVHGAVHRNEASLPDTLDRAVVATDLGADRTPIWWQIIRVLQWLLIGAVVVGALWLALNVVLGYFGLPRVEVYPVGPEGGLQVPVPTILVGGGIVAGIVLSGISGLIIAASANSAAKRARRALEASVGNVAETHVLEPAMAEVARYGEARRAVASLIRP